MAESTTIARPYAKAAYLFASENNQLDAWESALALLAALVNEADVQKALADPRLSADGKAQVLADICADELNDGARNLVSQLAQNGRLALLPAIHELYHQFMAAHQKFADVELLSAHELEGAEVEKLTAALKKRLGVDVKVSTGVDESLIGGVLVRAGDTVIDSSVRGRLQKLAEQLNSRV